MIQLRTTTEHSGRRGTGTVRDLVAFAVAHGCSAVALTDTTTFGHVAFEKECLANGIEPIFGLTRADGVVMLAKDSVEDLYAERWEKCVALLPWGRNSNDAGLPYSQASYWMVDPTTPRDEVATHIPQHRFVAVSRPRCVLPDQTALHQLSSGSVGYHYPIHLLVERELDDLHPAHYPNLLHNTNRVAGLCRAHALPRAGNPQASETEDEFRRLAQQALRVRMTGREVSAAYWERLDHELEVVADKSYQGYFEMVSELVLWAKSVGIRVGPGRGSACGSLLCWVLGITEIDPMPHGLLFERFLDPSRPDLPDVDLDFQEDRRDEVFAHLRETYGEARVARLGSTLRRGGKGALMDGLRALGRKPDAKLKAVAESIEVRLAGEEGSPTTLRDALDHAGITDPEVRACCALEGTVSAHGKHAAGVVVAPDALARYVHVVDGVAEADLHDAEALGLVKLDCLGLRTLTVLDAACRRAGIPWDSLPMPGAVLERDLQPLREGRFAGIFQFEGAALQGLTRQAPPSSFEDVALLTAVARPGPLQAGTGEELKRIRKGSRVLTSPMWDGLPLLAEATRDADGLLVYQEQVMSLFRGLGFDWPTVAKVRKAMAKSQGRGGMEAYAVEFRERCEARGISDGEICATWNALIGCGAYLFNKSHAVAYALLSCWCSTLKSRHPEAFYAAALDHARSVEDGLTLIREARAAGIEVIPFHPHWSGLTWKAGPKQLIGSWLCLPGVGELKAKDLIQRRDEKRLTVLQERLIAGPTVYDEPTEGLAELREQAGASDLASLQARGGGRVAAKLAEVRCLDWTSPKSVKRYGPAKPGRERTYILKLTDAAAELEVRVSGKLVAQLEPRVKELVAGSLCVLEASRFDGDGRFYLREVL